MRDYYNIQGEIRSNIITTKEIVGNIIKNNNDIINNDFKLYLETLERMGIDTNLSIKELFSNSVAYDLPVMESVSRARRYWMEDLGIVRDTEHKEQEYKNIFKHK